MIYQIWAAFKKEDPQDYHWAPPAYVVGGDHRRHPTSTALFAKGQLMGDGQTPIVDFEREYAEEQGEELVLMHEFEGGGARGLTKLQEWEAAKDVDRAYWEGYHAKHR